MDYQTYRHAYFTDPPPPPRFDLEGVLGLTLFFVTLALNLIALAVVRRFREQYE